MIESLSYVGFTSPNAAVWQSFGPDVLGLEIARTEPDGTVRLRVDDAVHRISIHPGKTEDLSYLGWSVAGPAALDSLGETLRKAGFDTHAADANLLEERQVAELIWFEDPFGFRHEVAWGLLSKPSSFKPGRPLSGFVTGSGGLGHLVLILPDLARAEAFYSRVLGFRLSDRVEIGRSLRFFHCNPRHHTLAIAHAPGMVGIHHLMLEVASLDDVGTALDLCIARDIPITRSLGKHTNDLMTSFYMRSPSGFEIEYGWGGRLIDDEENWTVGSYDAVSIWGHRHPAEPAAPAIIRPFEETAT